MLCDWTGWKRGKEQHGTEKFGEKRRKKQIVVLHWILVNYSTFYPQNLVFLKKSCKFKTKVCMVYVHDVDFSYFFRVYDGWRKCKKIFKKSTFSSIQITYLKDVRIRICEDSKVVSGIKKSYVSKFILFSKSGKGRIWYYATIFWNSLFFLMGV
jgi:hypothetical protein